jgi:hypothetical protein
MNIIAIVFAINSLALSFVIFYALQRMFENEALRFREFVKAVLARDADKYVDIIPEDGIAIQQKKTDEFIELDNMDEEDLIGVLQKEYENK